LGPASPFSRFANHENLLLFVGWPPAVRVGMMRSERRPGAPQDQSHLTKTVGRTKKVILVAQRLRVGLGLLLSDWGLQKSLFTDGALGQSLTELMELMSC
jgi:hypothetical protein